MCTKGYPFFVDDIKLWIELVSKKEDLVLPVIVIYSDEHSSYGFRNVYRDENGTSGPLEKREFFIRLPGLYEPFDLIHSTEKVELCECVLHIISAAALSSQAALDCLSVSVNFHPNYKLFLVKVYKYAETPQSKPELNPSTSSFIFESISRQGTVFSKIITTIGSSLFRKASNEAYNKNDEGNTSFLANSTDIPLNDVSPFLRVTQNTK